MDNIIKHIKERRSVRTFDGRTLDEYTREQLAAFASNIPNPWNISVKFKFLDAKRDGLKCPVACGTDAYVGGKIKCGPDAAAAFGYSFETFVLYAQSLGLGTVWLGGTMNRSAFEQAMELGADEVMPCAAPIGYVSQKMSLRENMMRKAIKADERLTFEALFFNRSFDNPLTVEKAGKFAEPLEMVRLAPSAANKQPWRVIAEENAVHFYLKRSKGFGREGKFDMQKIDMGIALCHFALAAEASGLAVAFERNDPKILPDSAVEYVASYVIA